jgi:hypothetical protein
LGKERGRKEGISKGRRRMLGNKGGREREGKAMGAREQI